MKRIRAGIIGAGKIGAAHLDALRRLGYAEAVALVVRDAAKAEALRDEYGVDKCYADYREMLADPDVDVVHNCTPNPAHLLINRDCILAGKPVLSEKPLTTGPRDSAELADLAKSRNVPTAVNFVNRHYSMVRHAKGMIEAGELGEIYSISGAYFQDWLLRGDDYDWRVEARLGGPSRAMADVGSHWCDLARFLLGREIEEVCADIATFVPERIDASGKAPRRVAVDTEDYASVLLRFAGGSRGSFVVSQTCPGRRVGLSFEIAGSRASVRWEFERPDRLWIGRRDAPNGELLMNPAVLNASAASQPLSGCRPDAQRNMIDSFYRTILYGEPPRHAEFADGAAMDAVVAAVLESAASGRWRKLGQGLA